jgi:hypothetical protein
MSRRPISRSTDLQRLQNEGYNIEVRAGYLLVHDVPYLDGRGAVGRGIIVSELTLTGDVTAPPSTHVVYFAGGFPHDASGSEIHGIRHGSGRNTLAPDVVVDHSFSAKPTSGAYPDYYEKITTYVSILSSPAASIDPSATARTYPVIEDREEETVFKYIDTASSRAGIAAVTDNLVGRRIAIVGLGGTGAYVLDMIAKTPVQEIHLFDGDTMFQHNAFRSPGAPSVEDLERRVPKVEHFREIYSRMRRNIEAHDYYLDKSNGGLLHGMDFVFLCLDRNDERGQIVTSLVQAGVPFVDVGMGVEVDDGGSLGGILRITTSTATKHDHLSRRVPMGAVSGEGDYATNIQIADLNALNAALAVIKWKKLCGFYRDLEGEHHSTYTIDGNTIAVDDCES